jgi:hypothetical protein
MDFVIFVTTYLRDSTVHFWFSGLAGCLAYSLILTILYAVYRIRHSTVPLTKGQNYFMLGLALLGAFFVAWLVHGLLDAFTDWWTTPLGAPLTIIR